MEMQSTQAVARLGELLRYWRQERSISQLELSMDTGISQRHFELCGKRAERSEPRFSFHCF